MLASVAATPALWSRGVSSRGVKPTPRGKPSGIPFLAQFFDVGARAGLTAPTIYGAPAKKQNVLEGVGCGVAFLDFDNDGWLDIFVLCGTCSEPVPASATNRLYRNNRDETFTDITDKAGLHRTGWASSVTVGDYNNDGFEDLFITYYGENVLYRNNGDGTFTDITEKAGLRQASNLWGSGCTFVDYDRDGNLDLFIANYLDLDLQNLPKPGERSTCGWKGVPVYCGPLGLKFARNYLFHNNGDGTFQDVSESSGIAKLDHGYAMTAVAADFDSDGYPDIYIACDSTRSYFLHNQRNGTFKEEGLERGVAVSEDGLEQAGMGVAVGDFDLDGKLDIFKTHFADDTSVIYRNDGSAHFADMTLAAGFGVETRYISWGTGLVDFDNDGLPDIFVATGSIYPEIEQVRPQYPWKTPRLIFRNLGDGHFEELIEAAGPGISATHSSRGCAFGDFDNDGDLDVVVINMDEPPSLLRNDLQSERKWIKVFLIGTRSNRSAIGSRVIASYGGKKQAQTITAQASFYSCNDRRLHFGLGAAESANIEVYWPNGGLEKYSAVPARHLVTIKEGAGISKLEKWDSNSSPRKPKT
jgi:enediyne biosynthesis protein E4